MSEGERNDEYELFVRPSWRVILSAFHSIPDYFGIAESLVQYYFQWKMIKN